MLRAEPQRHRGTEKTQSRPTSQTRRHQDTKKSQSRPPLTEKPQITQINADSPRGFSAWRGPGRRRTTAGNRWAGPPLRTRASVTVVRPSGPRSDERRPRHSSPSFYGWDGHASRPKGEDVRRNRRAPSAATGGKSGCDERLRSEQTGLPPVGGDRQIAARSAVNPRHRRITSATNSLCLRVFVFAMSSSVFLLCASVPLWFTGGRFLGIA